MKIKTAGTLFFGWLITLLLLLPATIFAADCSTDIKATTTAKPQVAVDVLGYQLKPLTKCNLEVEAQAWLLLLQQKVAEISTAEIAIIITKDEIKKEHAVDAAIEKAEQVNQNADNGAVKKADIKANDAIKTAHETEQIIADDADLKQVIVTAKVKAENNNAASSTQPITSKADLKIALVKHVTDLTTQQIAIVDRLNAVLSELVAKGGNADEYNSYIDAVSGLKVDVADASATWTIISGWAMSSEGGFRWIANIVKFIATIIIFYFLAIFTGKIANHTFSKSRHFSTLLRDFLVLSSRRLVLCIGLFVGLSTLEINLAPLLAVIGATGFVIAFALQNSLSNFASGILMLMYRPFDLNDMIDVAGVLGTVESMNLLSTQLRTPDNKLVIVPNNSVWGDVITNVTGINNRRVDLVFGIGYSDDIDKAQKVLETVVAGHPLVLKNPEAMVKLHELADSSVNFVCRPWVKPCDYWDVYWDITKEVKRQFDAAGISIPFPQQDVHFYQETTTATALPTENKVDEKNC